MLLLEGVWIILLRFFADVREHLVSTIKGVLVAGGSLDVVREFLGYITLKIME